MIVSRSAGLKTELELSGRFHASPSCRNIPTGSTRGRLKSQRLWRARIFMQTTSEPTMTSKSLSRAFMKLHNFLLLATVSSVLCAVFTLSLPLAKYRRRRPLCLWISVSHVLWDHIVPDDTLARRLTTGSSPIVFRGKKIAGTR